MEGQAAVLLEAGDRRDADDRLTEAVVAYGQAFEANPQDADAALRIGHVLMHLGRCQEAVPTLVEAAQTAFDVDLRHGPPAPDDAALEDKAFVELLTLLGRCRLVDGPDAQGLAMLESVLAVRENAVDLHYLLGRQYLRGDQHAQALHHLSAYLIAHPDDAKVLAVVGNLHLRLGGLDRAAHHYERALALAPATTAVLRNLAVVRFRTGDHEHAIRAYRELLQRRPDDSVSRFNLGVSLAVRGDDRGAVEQLEAAMRLDPSLTQGWYRLGLSLERIGRLGDATEAFERAVEAGPDVLAAYRAMARALRSQGRLADATGALSKALELAPSHLEVLLALGDCLREQERAGDALALHRRAAEIAVDDVRTHLALGADYEALREHERAVDSYRAAIALQADSSRAREGLGSSLTRAGAGWIRDGQLDRGIEALQEAAGLRPDAFAVHLDLGVAHLAVGHTQPAEAPLRRALALDPTSAKAKLALADLRLRQGDARQALSLAREIDDGASEAERVYARTLRAMALAQLGELERAVTLFRQAAQADKSNLGLRYNFGRTLVLAGHYDEGLRTLRSLPERLRDLDDAAHRSLSAIRGYASSRIADSVAAVRHLTAACAGKSPPESWRKALGAATIQLGLDLESRGLRDEALGVFRQAVRDFADPVAAANAATLLYRMGRHQQALEAFEQLASEGHPAAVFHNLAVYYDDVADDDEAAYRWYVRYQLSATVSDRSGVAARLERKRALFGLP